MKASEIWKLIKERSPEVAWRKTGVENHKGIQLRCILAEGFYTIMIPLQDWNKSQCSICGNMGNQWDNGKGGELCQECWESYGIQVSTKGLA